MSDLRLFLTHPDGHLTLDRETMRAAFFGENAAVTQQFLAALEKNLTAKPWLANEVFNIVKGYVFKSAIEGNRPAFHALRIARDANPAALTEKAVLLARVYLTDTHALDKSLALRLIKDAVGSLTSSAQQYRPAWVTETLITALAQTSQSPRTMDSNKHLARETLASLMRFGPMRSLGLSIATRKISSFRTADAQISLELMPSILGASPQEAPKVLAIAKEGLKRHDLSVRLHALRIIQQICHFDPQLARPALDVIVPLTVTDELDPALFPPLCAVAWDMRSKMTRENPALAPLADQIETEERARRERRPLRRLVSLVSKCLPDKVISVPVLRKPKGPAPS